MIFVYKDRIIQIEWSIFRGTSQVPEDFSRALVKLFLVGNYEKYAVPVTAEGGTLVAQMPQDLPDGAYSLEAIWVKNYNNLFPVRGTDTPSVGAKNIRYPGTCHNAYGMLHPWDHRSNDRCLMRSRKEYVFAVTSYQGEETAVNEDGSVTIRISSAVATYGYDGLSAYELAVMRGDFNGTEGEWLEQLKFELEVAQEHKLGGITAVTKTDSETEEVKVDPKTGRLYVKPGEGELSVATETTLGGIKAAAKTENETVEVKIDSKTGKLYTKSGNNPDDEDLHLVEQEDKQVLQLADKEYNSDSFSGLGRVYLRKNISASKNVLTQEMINKPNTRYIIQYDYDLNGTTVNIPEGCELDFQGGSLKNGTLTGNNTKFSSKCLYQIYIDITFEGTWIVDYISSKYFHYENNKMLYNAIEILSKSDILTSIDIEKCNTNILPVISQDDVAIFFDMQSNSIIDFNDSTLILSKNSFFYYRLFNIAGKQNIRFKNLNIIGDIDYHPSDNSEYGHGIYVKQSNNIHIENVIVSKMWGDGIDVIGDTIDGNYILSKNIYINNSIFSECRRNGISIINGENISIDNCISEYNGTLNGTNPKAGIDIEPNNSNESLKNINVKNSVFTNNGQFGVIVNNSKGNTILNSKEVKFSNCIINNLYQEGTGGYFEACNLDNKLSLQGHTYSIVNCSIPSYMINSSNSDKNILIGNNIYKNLPISNRISSFQMSPSQCCLIECPILKNGIIEISCCDGLSYLGFQKMYYRYSGDSGNEKLTKIKDDCIISSYEHVIDLNFRGIENAVKDIENNCFKIYVKSKTNATVNGYFDVKLNSFPYSHKRIFINRIELTTEIDNEKCGLMFHPNIITGIFQSNDVLTNYRLGIGQQVYDLYSKRLLTYTEDLLVNSDGTLLSKVIIANRKDVFIYENFTYKITTDIDLNGETVNIPSNCILDFHGGKFINGAVNFNNTKLLPFGLVINDYFQSVTLNNSYKESQVIYDIYLKKMKLWNGLSWVNLDGTPL